MITISIMANEYFYLTFKFYNKTNDLRLSISILLVYKLLQKFKVFVND